MQLEGLRKNKLSSKAIIHVLIICLLLIACSPYQIKPVSSETIQVVPGQKIQTAVNNAAVGDTIQVAAGIYYEHIVVNKSLTIAGENSQTTIIDGTGNGTIFDLDGSNINITGFTIRNAGNNNYAIMSEKAAPTNDNHRITNNIITTSSCGIYLSLSNLNKILNNEFINNAFQSILLNNSGNNNITGNTITEGAYGIRMLFSNNNIIVGNTISQTSFGVHLTSSSTGSTIRQNTISARNTGIYSTSDSTIVDHNTITGGSYGIYFYNCKSGSIYYNILENSASGIRLYSTTASHTVNNNKILNADWGIELINSNGNTFTGNWLLQNTYGMSLAGSSLNTIYHSNFINNNMQANSPASNTWDNGYPSGGNYWSDYTGVDLKNGPGQNLPGSDGIGDTQYTVHGSNIDHYPLMNTWSEHDVSVESVTPSTNSAYVGATITITVTVKNKASTTVSETFTVTAKYNSSIIGTQTVNPALEQGATRTLSFSWVTIGVTPGNYKISALASTVPNELNTDNNILINGTVRIKVHLVGDINPIPDDIVNFADLNILNQAFGSTGGPPPSPNWNQNADINKDNIIDAQDLQLLSKNFGKTT